MNAVCEFYKLAVMHFEANQILATIISDVKPCCVGISVLNVNEKKSILAGNLYKSWLLS